MVCVALCAGYATRLYPLTENFPKPLLEVRGKTILDWLADDIEASGEVDRFVVVSNHKFAPHFADWADKKQTGMEITVIDDGTESNETRLGAVRDVQIAIEKMDIRDDILVVAGDNVLDFSLSVFLRYAKEKDATCLMRYYVEDPARLKKSGVIQPDADGRVLRMEEKPAVPFANWCAPPFYVYSRRDIPRVREALDGGCSADAPGSFIAWLSSRSPVYAMEMPGKRYDIGDIRSYEQVKADYQGIVK